MVRLDCQWNHSFFTEGAEPPRRSHAQQHFAAVNHLTSACALQVQGESCCIGAIRAERNTEVRTGGGGRGAPGDGGGGGCGHRGAMRRGGGGGWRVPGGCALGWITFMWHTGMLRLHLRRWPVHSPNTRDMAAVLCVGEGGDCPPGAAVLRHLSLRRASDTRYPPGYLYT